MVVDFKQFVNLMTRFNLTDIHHIAVGVSGGADSLCLTFLLAEWAKYTGKQLTAITVNHNLRAVATQEATDVHTLLEQAGISHVTLKNETSIPPSGIEEYARRIRYKLLTDYCHAHQINTLFLAHHAGDQAETFLFRLSKKSGLTGLRAMLPEVTTNGIRICRPFLTISKNDIIDTLKSKQISWIEDEMNHDDFYTRVQFRHFLPQLSTLGILPETVATVTERLARADNALQHYVYQFINKHVWIDYRGFARVPIPALQECPFEIQIRIISTLIDRIGQSGKFISLKSVEELCVKLPCSATLGECVFVPHRTGLYIAKEAKHIKAGRFITPHTPTQWDRFLITATHPCFIQAAPPIDKIENIPAIVQKTFPAVFMQKELEKSVQIDYKEKNDSNIQIQFLTQTEGYIQE